jgi:hypothetical protein
MILTSAASLFLQESQSRLRCICSETIRCTFQGEKLAVQQTIAVRKLLPGKRITPPKCLVSYDLKRALLVSKFSFSRSPTPYRKMPIHSQKPLEGLGQTICLDTTGITCTDSFENSLSFIPS